MNCGFKKFFAFTLAEVLITLGIIGIVAAITIPTIISKYQKSQTISKLKKVNAVLSQMILQSVADNGSVAAFLNPNSDVTSERTKQFFDTYWLPYFNSPKVYSTKPFSKGNAYKYLNNGIIDIGIYTSYSNGRIFFITRDGITFFVIVMGWDKKYDNDGNLISQTAKYATTQSVYVDINGLKEPNTLGKDIFFYQIDFSNNTARPYGLSRPIEETDCKVGGYGRTCAAKIIRDGWKIADDYPVKF